MQEIRYGKNIGFSYAIPWLSLIIRSAILDASKAEIVGITSNLLSLMLRVSVRSSPVSSYRLFPNPLPGSPKSSG